jgi:crotonobetaine/carnitine-CoA ligase
LATCWPDMVRHRVTYLCMIETILLMLERNPPCAEERSNFLRAVLSPGNPAVIQRCEARFGFRIVQVWGMTEAGVGTGVPQSLTMDEVNALRNWPKHGFLAGWPLSKDSKIRLVADGQVVVGEGASGEIQFSSRMLFSQYYADPQGTAAAFDGEWMKTGDLGLYGPGAVLYFQDRLKDVIRRGGENIASKQVEDVLLAHPKVRHAAVVPVPDPLFIQEVKAFVVVDGEVSTAELWSWCDDRLARYKVPRYLEFTDALPVNGSGRVQKQKLIAAGHGTMFDRRAEKGAART